MVAPFCHKNQIGLFMAEKLSEKDIENINIEGTEEYAVMPLRNTVLFPQQVIPIYIGREKSLKLISDIELEKRKYIIVVAQEDGSIEDPSTEDLIFIWYISHSAQSFCYA